MTNKIIKLFLVCSMIQSSPCQFVISHKTYDSSSTCENTKSSRLVEHFFNLIFSEFHSTPPVCTCVQMCPDRPAYCYPNGCMKRTMKETDTKTSQENYKSNPQTKINPDNSKPITLIVEQRDDFVTDIFDTPPETNAGTDKMDKQYKTVKINFQPKIFKDRLNTLIKNKKMPKVELKYNLRTRVNTMKSTNLRIESVDKSKRKWANYKHNPQKQLKSATDTENFITTVFIENTPTFAQRNYSKKDNQDGKSNSLHNKINATEKVPQDLNNLINIQFNSNLDKKNNKNISQEPLIKNLPPNKSAIGKEDTSHTPNNNLKQRMTEEIGTNNYKNDILISDEMYNNTFNEMIISWASSIRNRDNASLDRVKTLEDIN